MMTENQLEIAAREYCRLAEMDAEKKVPTSPSPNPDGSVNMVCIWVPAWKAVAEMIAQQDMVRHCIDLANVKAHIRATEDTQPDQMDGGALCDASCSDSSFVESLFVLLSKHLVKNKEWLTPTIGTWAGVVEQQARGTFDVRDHYSFVRKAVEEL